MEDIAGWIAPIATMIAAMMTAANLGARITGWGFVVFTVGSIAWTVVGVSSGQTNLIAANGFLTIVNVIGIWRWLGREAKYADKTHKLVEESAGAPLPSLTAAASLVGCPVNDASGKAVAHVVDTMIACDDGRIRGLMVRHGGTGGIGERVVVLPPTAFMLGGESVATSLDEAALRTLPEVED